MTTVFDAGTSGPRTHALVIGVGQYPHCAASSLAATTGTEAALLRNFENLTSPPPSARRFAQWLMTGQVDNLVAPLGSVELLTSAPFWDSGQVHAPDGAVGGAAPTFGAVRQAFLRWYERCDTSPDNVAMFFFSGHGCANGDQYLLLEDFGEDPLHVFANAINVETFMAGMTRCAAETQCYFVDACRTVPHELLELSRVETNALIQPHTHSPLRNVAVVRSAAQGTEAQGVWGGTTPFTDALIEAMDGGAAVRGEGDRWVIDIARIATTVDRLLEWHGEQRPHVDYTGCRKKIIRELVSDPIVPFRFGSQPRDALASAALSLVGLDGQIRLARGPQPALWEDSTGPLIACSLKAEFSGRRYDDVFKEVSIVPPCIEEYLYPRVSGAPDATG